MRICPSCGYNTPIDTVERCPLDGKPLQRKGPAGDPMIGRVVGDRFRIEERIGKGGMGTVYKAKQLSIDRTVALKVVRNPGDEDLVERFQREARYISRVVDPHVVTLFDFGQAEDGILFIAMEFLNGESLAQRISRVSRLTPLAACDLAQQVCQALSAAHAKGIVHRDLKPDNIFYTVDDDGGGEAPKELVKVLDFGLAKAFRDEILDQSLTNVGDVFGTPLYMSPEQVRGEAVDHRTDLYALGVVLYECLTGSPPFRGQSVHETLHMQVSATPEPLAKRRPGLVVPQRLEKLLYSMLAKERDARPANARVARRLFEELSHELAQRQLRDSRAVDPLSSSGRTPSAQTETDNTPTDDVLTPEPRNVPTSRYQPKAAPLALRATEPKLEPPQPSTDTQPIAAEVTPTPLPLRRIRFSRSWYIGVGVGGVAIGTLLVILMPGDLGDARRTPSSAASPKEAPTATASASPSALPLASAASGGEPAAPGGAAADERAPGNAARAGAVAESGPSNGGQASGAEAPRLGLKLSSTPAPAASAAHPAPAATSAHPSAAKRRPSPDVLVRFESSPPGAQVFDGRRRLGVTPFETSVRRDRASVQYTAKLAGHREEARSVQLPAAGSRTTVTFRLTRLRRRRVAETAHRARPAPVKSRPAAPSKFGDHPVKFDD